MLFILEEYFFLRIAPCIFFPFAKRTYIFSLDINSDLFPGEHGGGRLFCAIRVRTLYTELLSYGLGFLRKFMDLVFWLVR